MRAWVRVWSGVESRRVGRSDESKSSFINIKEV